jgi:hypothetical protein
MAQKSCRSPSADAGTCLTAARQQPASLHTFADDTLDGPPCAMQVYVLGGAAHAADGSTIEAIRRAAFGVRRGRQLRGIMVLMDPDDTGRRGAATLCCLCAVLSWGFHHVHH